MTTMLRRPATATRAVNQPKSPFSDSQEKSFRQTTVNQTAADACLPDRQARPTRSPYRPSFSTAMNASCGISTCPTIRILFFPAFCFSKSFRLRVTSPP